MMKNYFIKPFLVLTFCAVTMGGTAQINVSAGLNYNFYLSVPPVQHFGASTAVEYNIDQSSARLFLNLGIPISAERSYDMKDIVTGNYVETIVGAEKYQFNQIIFDYKRYLIGDPESSGLYTASGAGLTTLTVKYQIGDYNQDALAPMVELPKKEKLYGFILRGGIGGELALTKGQIFAEGYFSMPLYQYSNPPSGNVLPMSIGFGIGYKLPLSK